MTIASSRDSGTRSGQQLFMLNYAVGAIAGDYVLRADALAGVDQLFRFQHGHQQQPDRGDAVTQHQADLDVWLGDEC